MYPLPKPLSTRGSVPPYVEATNPARYSDNGAYYRRPPEPQPEEVTPKAPQMRRGIVDSQLAAYHEPSHAVIGLWLGRKARRVQIDPLRPGNGQVLFEPWSVLDIEPKNKTSALLVWNHALSNAKTQAKILLAGPLAEAKLLRTPLRSLGLDHKSSQNQA
jgi:hypothetical protein